MSWRIENTNPFALLSELPDGWAQTCFLRPPRDLPTPCLLAMLDLVRRVLRDDGALWLSLPGRGSQPQVLQLVENAGWLRHARGPNGSRASLILRRSPVMLFSTQSAFHFTARLLMPDAAPPSPEDVCPARRSRQVSARRLRRRAWCVPAASGEVISPRFIDWCVRSSTPPRACGVCGAPWRYSPGSMDRGGQWRSGCSHSNGRGRSLVLDPYCSAFSDVGLAAVRAGRSYLGVAPDPDTVLRAQAVIEREARQ
jgi:hypothetical protein